MNGVIVGHRQPSDDPGGKEPYVASRSGAQMCAHCTLFGCLLVGWENSHQGPGGFELRIVQSPSSLMRALRAAADLLS